MDRLPGNAACRVNALGFYTVARIPQVAYSSAQPVYAIFP